MPVSSADFPARERLRFQHPACSFTARFNAQIPVKPPPRPVSRDCGAGKAAATVLRSRALRVGQTAPTDRQSAKIPISTAAGGSWDDSRHSKTSLGPERVHVFRSAKRFSDVRASEDSQPPCRHIPYRQNSDVLQPCFCRHVIWGGLQLQTTSELAADHFARSRFICGPVSGALDPFDPRSPNPGRAEPWFC
jgi:hypothetical protein